VVLENGQVGLESSVSLNDAAVADLQQRHKRRAEVPARQRLASKWLIWREYGKVDVHDTLASHRVSLLIHSLDVEKGLLSLMVVIRAQNDGNNVKLQPEARAQLRCHILESSRQTSADEFGEVLILVSLDLVDHKVGDQVLALLDGVVERDVLDKEVDQVDRVMDGQGYDSGVIVGEDSGNTDVKCLRDGVLAEFFWKWCFFVHVEPFS
jgi:hypothetical protein